MRCAIAETEGRTNKQTTHIVDQGITPKCVSKRIKDIIDGVYSDEAEKRQQRPNNGSMRLRKISVATSA